MLNRRSLFRLFRRLPALASVLPLLLLPLPLCLWGCADGGAADARDDLFLRIRARDASFTAVFPSSTNLGEEVVCAGERTGNRVTLTVVSPSRSAGLTAEITMPGPDPSGDGRSDDPAAWADPSGWRAALSGPGFPAPAPVDPGAARFLTGLCALLYGPAGSALGAGEAAEAGGPGKPDSPSGPGTESGAEASAWRVSLFAPSVRRAGSPESPGEEEILLTDSRGTLVLRPDGSPLRAVCRDLGGNFRAVRFEDYETKG